MDAWKSAGDGFSSPPRFLRGECGWRDPTEQWLDDHRKWWMQTCNRMRGCRPDPGVKESKRVRTAVGISIMRSDRSGCRFSMCNGMRRKPYLCGSKAPEAIMYKIRNGWFATFENCFYEIRITDGSCSENPGSRRIVDATAQSYLFTRCEWQVRCLMLFLEQNGYQESGGRITMVKIYGTLGPACQDEKILTEMFALGMTGMRLNL